MRQSCTAWVAGLLLSLGTQPVVAETIRLKDGQELSGTLIDDGEHVAIVVPREAVVAVDGQPFHNPPAPPFTAVDVNGVQHAVPDSKKRVTLVKFWATWCPHCRADVSLMKTLFRRYQEQGLQILAVSVDQDLEQLRAFVRNEHLPYPVILAYDPSAPPQQADLPDLYRARGVPAYFLIDSEGTIVRRFSGSLTEGEVDIDGALTPLLTSHMRPTLPERK